MRGLSSPPDGRDTMSERDELAETIASKLDTFFGKREFGPAEQDLQLADALLAAGYRKPRTVTTAAELDAAIIRAFENGENLVLLEKGGWRPYILWEDDRGDLHVTSTPMEDDPERLTPSDIALPATVLYEGSAP